MNTPKTVTVNNLVIGRGQPLTIISGPCVIEDEEHTLACARTLKAMLSAFPVQFIFKACYDKANRMSYTSFRGPGLVRGLEILQRVKQEVGVPVISDVHSPEEVDQAAQVLDVIQIPAFLCRQTDLVVKAASTGLPLHVKKGQFMAPWDMKTVVDKIEAAGNHKIILADRGTSFGYNNLVSDMRSIPIMQRFGYPVCFDASHSVQRPGAQGTSSGGDREFIAPLARAAIACGCNVLFIETHPTPETAKSDASIVYPLAELPELLKVLVRLYEVVN